MKASSALYSVLSGASAVTDLVSTRIYPVKAPQNVAHPYITFQQITGGYVNSLSGYSGLRSPLYQVDVWADDYPGATDIAKAVRQAMDAATTIKTVLIEEREDYENDTSLYRVSQDFSIWHKET